MKIAIIDARFDLTAGTVYVDGRGRGSNVRAAIGRAVRDLLKQPKLRKKRFTMFTARVTIGEVSAGNKA
jgi:hypothetical protein